MSEFINEAIELYLSNIGTFLLLALIFIAIFVYGWIRKKIHYCFAIIFVIPVLWSAIHYSIIVAKLEQDKKNPKTYIIQGEVEDIGGSNIDSTIEIKGVKYLISRRLRFDKDIDEGEIFEVKYLPKSKYIVEATEIIE